MEIFEESFEIARDQLNETLALIAVGRLAKAQLPCSQAELPAKEQGLINARSSCKTTRLQLLRMLNPLGADLWSRDVDVIF